MEINCYFEVQGTNYIGAPYGILHTNDWLENITWRHLVYGQPELSSDAATSGDEFTYHYPVRAGDCVIYVGDRPVSTFFNNQYLDPPTTDID